MVLKLGQALLLTHDQTLDSVQCFLLLCCETGNAAPLCIFRVVN